eukprot:gene10290-7192_t
MTSSYMHFRPLDGPRLGIQRLLPMRNGLKIPQLGFGTYRLTPAQAEEVLPLAIDAGYRHIDCAKAYTNQVGDLFITSKLWPTDQHPDVVRKACEETLTELGVGYLDLYLIHWPICWKHSPNFLTEEDKYPKDPLKGGAAVDKSVSLLDTWRAMNELVKDGLVKSIGLCNSSAENISDVMAGGDDEALMAPVLNQIEFHPACQDTALVKVHKAHDMLTAAYCPLGMATRTTPPDFKPLVEEEILKSMSDLTGFSVPRLLLNWNLDQNNVVICKSANKAHIQSNAKASQFALSDSVRLVLNSFHEKVRACRVMNPKNFTEAPGPRPIFTEEKDQNLNKDPSFSNFLQALHNTHSVSFFVALFFFSLSLYIFDAADPGLWVSVFEQNIALLRFLEESSNTTGRTLPVSQLFTGRIVFCAQSVRRSRALQGVQVPVITLLLGAVDLLPKEDVNVEEKVMEWFQRENKPVTPQFLTNALGESDIKKVRVYYLRFGGDDKQPEGEAEDGKGEKISEVQEEEELEDEPQEELETTDAAVPPPPPPPLLPLGEEEKRIWVQRLLDLHAQVGAAEKKVANLQKEPSAKTRVEQLRAAEKDVEVLEAAQRAAEEKDALVDPALFERYANAYRRSRQRWSQRKEYFMRLQNQMLMGAGVGGEGMLPMSKEELYEMLGIVTDELCGASLKDSAIYMLVIQAFQGKGETHTTSRGQIEPDPSLNPWLFSVAFSSFPIFLWIITYITSCAPRD